MATVTTSDRVRTLADMLHTLGDIPLSRIRYHPYPGTATEADVLGIHAREKRLCELIDGILVEKPMGTRESLLACAIIECLRRFIKPRRLGIVTGEAGMMKLELGLVRIPDVAFLSWASLPERKIPTESIPALAPDLAVEILSESNTAAEMKRKRADFFSAGTRLMWIVDPKACTVAVYSSVRKCQTLNETQALDGGTVLPGFKLPIRDLFAELDQEAPE